MITIVQVDESPCGHDDISGLYKPYAYKITYDNIEPTNVPAPTA